MWIGYSNLICALLKAFQSPADISLARTMLHDDFWLEEKTEKVFIIIFSTGCIGIQNKKSKQNKEQEPRFCK